MSTNQDINTLCKSLTELGFSVLFSVNTKDRDRTNPAIRGRTWISIHSPFNNKYIDKTIYGPCDLETIFNEVAGEALKTMIK